LTRPLISMA